MAIQHRGGDREYRGDQLEQGGKHRFDPHEEGVNPGAGRGRSVETLLKQTTQMVPRGDGPRDVGGLYKKRTIFVR